MNTPDLTIKPETPLNPGSTATIKMVTDDEPDDTPFLGGAAVLLVLALVTIAILVRRRDQ